mmetsp:Transcript_23324/g.54212  ORF Transcript_23324/g.54212 Transcript_23324/m.54212 type:complete len:188 (+) Transcript_23324:128-691(+)
MKEAFREAEDAREAFSRCSRRLTDFLSKLPDDPLGLRIQREVQRVLDNLTDGGNGLAAAAQASTPADDSEVAVLIQSATISAVWACQRAGWGLLEDVGTTVLGGETWFVQDSESAACLPLAAERRYAYACEIVISIATLLLDKMLATTSVQSGGSGESRMLGQHAAAALELARLKRQLAAAQLVPST